MMKVIDYINFLAYLDDDIEERRLMETNEMEKILWFYLNDFFQNKF